MMSRLLLGGQSAVRRVLGRGLAPTAMLVVALAVAPLPGYAASPDGAPPSLPELKKSFNDANEQAHEADILSEIAKALASCRATRIAADRLQCYDVFSAGIEGKIATPSPPEGAQPGPGGFKNNESVGGIASNWHWQKSLNGAIAAGLMPIFSEGDAPEWSHIHWAMFIRCRSGEKDLYLEADKKIFDGAIPVDVAIRLDDGKDISQPWEASVGGTALGLWGNERSTQIVAELLRHRHLSIHILMPNAKNIFLSFDLLGIESALVPIQDKCRS